ncbi:MAG: hypothetical protein EOO13_14655 [Chitinophagaceae bacterium]|nr:MAG: hypothetical protein EOO13_14655 [Chitinophagaceae bacterium]
MKNVYSILWLFFSAFALISCSDNKEDARPSFPPFQDTNVYGPKSEYLTGTTSKTWKYQKLLVGGQPLDPEFMDCQNGTRLTFHKQAHAYTTSVPAGADCQSNNGQWNLNEDETQLRIYPLNQRPAAWQILELSENMLHYIGTAVIDGETVSSEAWMVPDNSTGFPPFQDSNVFGPKSQLLTGNLGKTWKFQELLINGQPVSAVYMNCKEDIRLSYYKMGHTYMSMVPPSAGCSSGSGKWNLNTNETEMRMYPDNGNPYAWQIVELSDSLFHFTGTWIGIGPGAPFEARMIPE